MFQGVSLDMKQLAQWKFLLQVLCQMANASFNGKPCEMLEYHHLLQNPTTHKAWSFPEGNEFGWLAWGMRGQIKGTNTIFVVHKSKIPPERFKDVIYRKFVCTVRPTKAKTTCTRLTLGSIHINILDNCEIPMANMLLVKSFLNSIISTNAAKSMTVNIRHFFLNTLLKWTE